MNILKENRKSASHYENIRKVYSVWIMMEPPKHRQNTITEYSIQERNVIGNIKEAKDDYDLMTAVMICLDNGNEEPQVEILKLLRTILDKDMLSSQKKQILVNDFKIKMTERLESEVSIMCNLAEGLVDKTKVDMIQKFIKNLNLTPNEAMDAAEIPESERQKYLHVLTNK